MSYVFPLSVLLLFLHPSHLDKGSYKICLLGRRNMVGNVTLIPAPYLSQQNIAWLIDNIAGGVLVPDHAWPPEGVMNGHL